MNSTAPFLANLDTSFVNLWSLLRKLTEQGFIGRVHIDLKDYAADIFLDGSLTPVVREVDRAANTEVVEAGALHRVVLRVRETPGTINVFAGKDEASIPPPAITTPPPVSVEPEFAVDAPRVAQVEAQPVAPEIIPEPSAESNLVLPVSTEPPAPQLEEAVYRTGSYDDWPAIVTVTGEMIGAIERGINAAGANFLEIFNNVRLELADDYVFLDPMPQTFQYQSGAASLRTQPPLSVFVSGLSEALRRTIDRVAVGERSRRVRERIALELLPVVRKRGDTLERCGLRMQLDRITGTKVI